MTTRTPYEAQLAQSLQASFGPRWFTRFLSPADSVELALATNDPERERIQRNIETRALAFVHSILHGALHAGIVTIPQE